MALRWGLSHGLSEPIFREFFWTQQGLDFFGFAHLHKKKNINDFTSHMQGTNLQTNSLLELCHFVCNAGGLFEGNTVMHKYRHQPKKCLHRG